MKLKVYKSDGTSFAEKEFDIPTFEGDKGVALLKQCYGQLRDAEQKVKVLAALTEEGADLQPFDHVAAIETAKAAVRKPAPPARDPGITE